MQINNIYMFGFKAFNQGLIGHNDYKFEVGKTYEYKEDPVLCEHGFHFCFLPSQLDHNYRPIPTTEYAIVEILGKIVNDRNKAITNHIKILQQITREDVLNYVLIEETFEVFEAENDIQRFHWLMNSDSTLKQFHKDDGLCELANGTKLWFANGKLHRGDDLPAIEYANGDKKWYSRGRLHRKDDKPAVVYKNGRREWHMLGKLHRFNNLPAVIHETGKKEWHLKGMQYNVVTKVNPYWWYGETSYWWNDAR
jgi:hypothetical protein